MKIIMSLSTVCLLVLLLSAFLCDTARAQEGPTYRIETLDGQIVTGTLVSEDEEKVVLKTELLGELTIQKKNIRTMERIDTDRYRDGAYWFDNPQPTLYFFAPNAIGLKKGRGYYQNAWIFFNSANYGLTSNFSIGGGLIPLFLFGVSETPVWILPKVSVALANDLYLAAGALIVGVVGVDTETAGLIYASSTYGNSDRNLTAGIGYGFAGGDTSDSPMVNISGMVRISRTMYIITENYFFPGIDFSGIGSFGGRWTTENFALDFALFRPLGEDMDFIGIPWLGLSFPFGR